ncbi:hypothetical protein AKO1_012370 [Acrasis kona]|uniref:Uncharacterized protein n=1 Tax=Acrasis kona TaxID=1008807 RepID=A0AAW2YZK8_9EUKA
MKELEQMRNSLGKSPTVRDPRKNTVYQDLFSNYQLDGGDLTEILSTPEKKPLYPAISPILSNDETPPYRFGQQQQPLTEETHVYQRGTLLASDIYSHVQPDPTLSCSPIIPTTPGKNREGGGHDSDGDFEMGSMTPFPKKRMGAQQQDEYQRGQQELYIQQQQQMYMQHVQQQQAAHIQQMMQQNNNSQQLLAIAQQRANQLLQPQQQQQQQMYHLDTFNNDPLNTTEQQVEHGDDEKIRSDIIKAKRDSKLKKRRESLSKNRREATKKRFEKTNSKLRTRITKKGAPSPKPKAFGMNLNNQSHHQPQSLQTHLPQQQAFGNMNQHHQFTSNQPLRMKTPIKQPQPIYQQRFKTPTRAPVVSTPKIQSSSAQKPTGFVARKMPDFKSIHSRNPTTRATTTTDYHYKANYYHHHYNHHHKTHNN